MPMAPYTAAQRGMLSLAFQDSSEDSYSSHHGSSPTSSSTAYHGSRRAIDYDLLPSIALDKDGFEDIRLAAPKATLSPLRPNLGSRLLSTLSNAQPAAAALTRSGSVLHSRAKSWATLVPKLNPNASAPEKTKVQQPNRIFGDLFNGESAPVRLGVPTSSTKEKEESDLVMEYQATFTERPQRASARKTDRGQSVATVDTPKSSWFNRKATVTLPAASVHTAAQDKFLNMDVNTALFPHGPEDPLSPHAFNDLLLNATSLLLRMQAAYKEKVDYITTIQPEMDAQREEVEEAETRSKHLKLQLEDLSRQAAEQLKTNKELLEQLSEERLQAHEARTVRLVRRSTDNTDGVDEIAAPRRWKRGSAGSASDSGFESDADTSSVFSGGPETPSSGVQQPRLTLTPGYDLGTWPTSPAKSRDRPAAPLVRDGSPPIIARPLPGKRLGSEGAAWATVETLRHENQGLKAQIVEMHTTLQGCIEFVGGVAGS